MRWRRTVILLGRASRRSQLRVFIDSCDVEQGYRRAVPPLTIGGTPWWLLLLLLLFGCCCAPTAPAVLVLLLMLMLLVPLLVLVLVFCCCRRRRDCRPALPRCRSKTREERVQRRETGPQVTLRRGRRGTV